MAIAKRWEYKRETESLIMGAQEWQLGQSQ